jgi:hypothetical protein
VWRRILDYKRTTHLENKYNIIADVVLDMRSHKERLNKKWWYTWQTWVAPIQEKLVQHRLRWFDHIQQRLHEASVCSDILSRPDNIRRWRARPRLSWEKTIKKDLKKYNISKELTLNMSAWNVTIHLSKSWFRSYNIIINLYISYS